MIFMKILITGGGGFIGSSLVVNLSKFHEIVCLDHGKRYPQLKKLVNSNVELVEGDVANSDVIKKIMKDVDIIIHLAGGGGNTACMKDIKNAIMTHAYGTCNLIKEAKNYKVEHIIFSSSVSVYTLMKQRPIPFIEDITLEPGDLYGALKVFAENQIKNSGINYTILRFSNVYGYGVGIIETQIGGVIGNFIKAACGGEDINIFGTGQQRIDFININDVVKCVEMILKNPKAYNEIFNVGSGYLYRIEDLANEIANFAERIYKQKINIKKVPAPEEKVWPDRLMSIEKINKKINWFPSISLEDGLEEMVIKLKRC